MSNEPVKKGKLHDVTTRKSVSVDQFGIITASVTKTLATGNDGGGTEKYQASDFDVIGDAHPDYSYLLCTSVQLDDSSVVASITLTYQGINEETKRYRLVASGGQEPIQTHPAFAEDADGYDEILAGTGASAKNKAKFKGTEEDSEFDYFPANADHDLGGVTNYIVPNVEIEEVTCKKNSDMADPTWEENDIYDVGQIKDSGLDLSVGDRNWLLMGSRQEIIGGATKSTAIYRLSGTKGWNDKVYQKEEGN